MLNFTWWVTRKERFEVGKTAAFAGATSQGEAKA
jgi:hypothetical protein